MKKSIGGFVVCLLGLVACNVEHYEDCSDGFDDGEGFGGSHSRAGASATSSKAGAASNDAGTTSGGATPTAGTGSAGSATMAEGGESGEGGAPATVTPPDACEQERDCKRGYNCDLDVHQCLPAAEETCAELDTETSCTHRSDCTPVYGGTNCSCGQDCECHGGDPGCVCESFEFFVCRAVE